MKRVNLILLFVLQLYILKIQSILVMVVIIHLLERFDF